MVGPTPFGYIRVVTLPHITLTVHSTSLFPCWSMTGPCMTRCWALQKSGNQYRKLHYTYLRKSYQSLPSSPRKMVHWMDSVCLIYMCHWQHPSEIGSSFKLVCIYHHPLATRCINREISWKLIFFLFSFCLHPLTTASLTYFTFCLRIHEPNFQKKEFVYGGPKQIFLLGGPCFLPQWGNRSQLASWLL